MTRLLTWLRARRAKQYEDGFLDGFREGRLAGRWENIDAAIRASKHPLRHPVGPWQSVDALLGGHIVERDE